MAKLFKELRQKIPFGAQSRAHEKALRMMAEMPLHELRQAQQPNGNVKINILLDKQNR